MGKLDELFNKLDELSYSVRDSISEYTNQGRHEFAKEMKREDSALTALSVLLEVFGSSDQSYCEEFTFDGLELACSKVFSSVEMTLEVFKNNLSGGNG